MRHSVKLVVKRLSALLLSECIVVTTVPAPAIAADTDSSSTTASNPQVLSRNVPPTAVVTSRASASLKIAPEVASSAGRAAGATDSSHNGSVSDVHLKPRIAPPVAQTRRLARGSTQANTGAPGSGFVENKGQWDQSARFQLRSSGKTLWLTDRQRRDLRQFARKARRAVN